MAGEERQGPSLGAGSVRGGAGGSATAPSTAGPERRAEAATATAAGKATHRGQEARIPTAARLRHEPECEQQRWQPQQYAYARTRPRGLPCRRPQGPPERHVGQEGRRRRLVDTYMLGGKEARRLLIAPLKSLHQGCVRFLIHEFLVSSRLVFKPRTCIHNISSWRGRRWIGRQRR